MKKTDRTFGLLLAAICLLFSYCGILYSQSPYYTLKFSVRDTGAVDESSSYTTSVTTCRFNYEPVIPSGDYWFGRDTSQLDWQNLPDSLLKTMTCINSEINGPSYESSNQSMVWENIYAIKIVRNSSETMMIVFPVKIKSFVTFMDLGNIPFKTGIFDLTDDIVYSYSEGLRLKVPEGYNWLPGEKDKGL